MACHSWIASLGVVVRKFMHGTKVGGLRNASMCLPSVKFHSVSAYTASALQATDIGGIKVNASCCTLRPRVRPLPQRKLPH